MDDFKEWLFKIACWFFKQIAQGFISEVCKDVWKKWSKKISLKKLLMFIKFRLMPALKVLALCLVDFLVQIAVPLIAMVAKKIRTAAVQAVLSLRIILKTLLQRPS